MARGALLALNGEAPRDCVEEYSNAAAAALERLAATAALTEDQECDLLELRIFLAVLGRTLGGAGGTRGAWEFKRRRGRPRYSLADIIRGMQAADRVRALTAQSGQQEAEIAHVSAELGINRTELFNWMKRSDEINASLIHLYPK